MNIDASNAHCSPRILFPGYAWLRAGNRVLRPDGFRHPLPASGGEADPLVGSSPPGSLDRESMEDGFGPVAFPAATLTS